MKHTTKETYTAVVLAAGQGSRMGSPVKKQFMKLMGRPLIFYPLRAFQESDVDQIILVTGEDSIQYCRENIVKRYKFTKVVHIIAGGKERYESVYEALKKADSDYILIHDGARAFLDRDIIIRSMEGVKKYKACVIGMPVKDTIKVADRDHYAVSTPDRSTLWQMQTPQCFCTAEIRKAYRLMMEQKTAIKNQPGVQEELKITDDAMVMEHFGERKIKLIEGSYENIKITTPEDMLIGKAFLKMRRLKRRILKN